MTGAAFSARVDPAVWDRHPDYRALIVLAEGVENGPSDAASDTLLNAAVDHLRARGLARPADVPHLAAWRAAFSAFGAKPSRYPSSAEALASRVLKGDGLPRINRLVDLYNAISVRHLIPVGGEDADALAGELQLVVAAGDEPFDSRDGEVEHPRPGEIVWRDDEAVTCRRWNWRQGRRTQLTDGTRWAFFLFDRLEPFPLEQPDAAAEELRSQLRAWFPGCRLSELRLAP
jgi:DNA/RNA-binding domain of Phe-tRNA-synthetase-like protein